MLFVSHQWLGVTHPDARCDSDETKGPQGTPREQPSLKLTATSPLKIGRAPKGNEKVFQPSIFRCENVSFREGIYDVCIIYCIYFLHTFISPISPRNLQGMSQKKKPSMESLNLIFPSAWGRWYPRSCAIFEFPRWKNISQRCDQQLELLSFWLICFGPNLVLKSALQIWAELRLV